MGARDQIRRIGDQIDSLKRDALKRRLKLLQTHRITTVLDVGANAGQYALALRKAGFTGKIVSFEPGAAAFEQLRRRAGRDPRWQAVQLALGNRNHTSELFVSGDDRASSLLPMLPAHVQVAKYFAPVGTQAVEVRRLDASFAELTGPRDRVFLKIDAQGFERRILEGAGAVLDRLIGVQVELSLVPLYDGETSLPQMLRYLAGRKLALHSLEYGFCDPKTGRMLQCDGVFFREP